MLSAALNEKVTHSYVMDIKYFYSKYAFILIQAGVSEWGDKCSKLKGKWFVVIIVIKLQPTLRVIFAGGCPFIKYHAFFPHWYG